MLRRKMKKLRQRLSGKLLPFLLRGSQSYHRQILRLSIVDVRKGKGFQILTSNTGLKKAGGAYKESSEPPLFKTGSLLHLCS